MRTSNIDFTDILKRKLAINSTEESGDAFNVYQMAKKSLNENRSTSSNDVESFFSLSKNSRNANKYYTNWLTLIENIEEGCNMKTRAVSIFSEEIIPYIKNLNSLKESVLRSRIDEKSKSIILNSIKENKICDRILSNDKMIKKRFNIENFIDTKRYLPLENIVFECCSLLDTYSNIPPYGKLNIALEELSFYLQKQDVKYDKSKFVELVTEYFIYRNKEIDNDTKKKYKNVLKENIMISDKDLSNVKYFIEDGGFIQSDIQKMIYDFNNDNNKDLGKLKCKLQDIFERAPESVINKLPSLLETLRHILIVGSFNYEQIQDIVAYIPTRCIEKSHSSVNKVMKIYSLELEILEKQMSIITGDKYSMLQNYHKCICNCIKNIEDHLYKNSDFACRNLDMQLKDKCNKSYATLQEFKIFKFDNLIRATMVIDKFLRKKSVKITDTITNKSKKIFKATKDFFKNKDKDEIFTEQDILNMGIITEDDNIDMCLAIYEVYEEEVKEVNSLMEQLCDLLNKQAIGNNKDMNVYYTNIGNIFELHLESNIILSLTEEEEAIRNNTISTRDMFYMEKIVNISECFDILSNINIDNMVESCMNIIESSSNIEPIKEVIKLFSYTNSISKKDILNIKEAYADIYPDNYINNTILNNVVQEYWSDNKQYTNLYIQTEALESINKVLNEAEEEIKEKKKSSSKSLEAKINNMKIYSMAIKKKAKDLSSKEQELSRNVDATVNTLARSMKQAVVSDRREAIIKGSIIPSFSKLVKTGIALAGVALINPICSIVAIVGGLAASKYLTHKERSLLLDEIEIEMKVVEKEIQIAENNNNMKKYRELMTFQKKLQREHSRIRYGLKAGRDLPDNPANDY